MQESGSSLNQSDLLPNKEIVTQINIGSFASPENSNELENGDNVYVDKLDGRYTILCDGTSDCRSDSEASKTGVEEISSRLSSFEPKSSDMAKMIVRRSIVQASEILKQKGLSSTASVCYIFYPPENPSEPELIIGNCGDSRVYAYDENNQEITQLTRDDNQIYNDKNLSESDADRIQLEINEATSFDQLSDIAKVYFQHRRYVSNCLGNEGCKPHIYFKKLKPGMTIVMGSDGPFDNLSNEQLKNILKKQLSAKETAHEIVLEGKMQSRNPDNFRHKPDDGSSIVIKIK